VFVERTHHVDRIPPDLTAVPMQTYVYDLFRFSEGNEVLLARSYSIEPFDAHFLRREACSVHLGLTSKDTTTPLFAAAVSYLRGIGMLRVEWLNIEGEGYEPVPTSN